MNETDKQIYKEIQERDVKIQELINKGFTMSTIIANDQLYEDIRIRDGIIQEFQQYKEKTELLLKELKSKIASFERETSSEKKKLSDIAVILSVPEDDEVYCEYCNSMQTFYKLKFIKEILSRKE